MSLQIRESFQVAAPPARAWEFLVDPARVVRCLPGATLTETVDERTYRGKVTVKVGPISTAYEGTARLTDVDAATRTMRMVGEGRELGAAGSAKMTMVGTVSPHADGGSLVEVDATVDIAGRVMQFGRGLVESFSRQLFKQFAAAVRETLEVVETREEAAATASSEASTDGAAVAALASPPVSAAIAAEPSARELRVLPLLWRALVDWVRRLFRR
jgi:carbon monoxide dehydrogenase subunit G